MKILESKWRWAVGLIAAVVGALALLAYAVSGHSDASGAGYRSGTEAKMDFLSTMVETYAAKYGRAPSSLVELHATFRASGEEVPTILVDMWDRPLLFAITNSVQDGEGSIRKTNAIIISYGADGIPGGVGEDRDIEILTDVGKYYFK